MVLCRLVNRGHRDIEVFYETLKVKILLRKQPSHLFNNSLRVFFYLGFSV